MSRIALIIPTISERAESLKRFMESAKDTAGSHEIEFFTAIDKQTCGLGWQAALDLLDESISTGIVKKPDYLYFACDDVVCLPNCWDAGIDTVEAGFTPAPHTINMDDGELIGYGHPPDGSMEDWKICRTSVGPFCSFEAWKNTGGKMAPWHYYTDDYASEQLRRVGFPVRARLSYNFGHYWEQAGRGAGMSQQQRLNHDHVLFSRWMKTGKLESKI